MHEKTILKNIRQADARYNLINNNDRILLGVSGGKDSLALLYCLKKYQEIVTFKFEIIPAIIDLGFPNFDASPIKEYVKSLDYDLKIVDGRDVYKILKIEQEEKHEKKLSCSICSRMKKAIMNKIAKENNCNKVAFAHHADDAIETFFLNATFGGKLATFSPKMFLERSKITFIRPFIFVRESDISSLLKEANIPSFQSNCPNDKKTMRELVKNELKNIYDFYPLARKNYYRLLVNADKQDLWNKEVYLKVYGNNNLSLKKIATPEDAYLETKLRLNLYVQELKEDINLEFGDEKYKTGRYLIYQFLDPVGIVSLWKNESAFSIKIAFKKETTNESFLKDVIRFLESKLRRINKNFPIEIYNDKNNETILKGIGYARAHNNKVITKLTKYIKIFD